MSEETLFQEALAKPPSQRAAFLEAACVGQPQLRAAVEALLAKHDAPHRLVTGEGDAPALQQTTTLPPASSPINQEAETLPPAPDAAHTSSAPARASDILLGGKYRLLQVLGEGGMGTVCQAEQIEPVRRPVAVKLIKIGMDSGQVLARFEAERQALAVMDHPNIAKVFDAGVDEGGQPFFVMELVQGVPLTRFCDEARLSVRERLKLFLPICQAVQHAHQKGVIHRDLKPSNILVALCDDEPAPKIIDFGIAKATGQKLTERTMQTQVGAVVGTLEYMSPEQAGGATDIDTRSDIYSLGVILYELLTGTTPLGSIPLTNGALLDLLVRICEEEPPRPSVRLSESADKLASISDQRKSEPAKLIKLVRGELDWIVMKALEKARVRRYQTANGLALEVHRYLADEPVEARPPSAGYRLGKLLRRNKGAVLAAGLVLLALVGGIIGTSLGMIRAEQRSVEAEEARLREAARAEGERQAKEREAEQRAKAEKARDRTRQALDAMTSSVTGDSLTTQKALSDEQKKFLSGVLSYYQEFAGEKADDEQSRTRTAAAANRVATIEYRLGRMTEAAAANRLACDGYAKLAADFPAVPQYRHELALSHNNLGLELAGLGKRPEAEQQYRQALDIQERLAADFPAVSKYRQGVADSHHNLGILLDDLGKRPEAEQQVRQALDIREKLVADFPAVPEYRQGLARSHNSLGIVLTALGKGPEAVQQFRQALDIKEKLAADFPAVPEYRQELARSHNSLGIVLTALGKGPEAEQHYRQALAILEKLAADFPAVPGYQISLGGSSCNFGNLVSDSGRPSESLVWFDKAIRTLTAVYQQDRQLVVAKRFLRNSHLSRARAYDRLHKYAEAVNDWDKAIELSPKAEQPEFQTSLSGSSCNFGNLLVASGRPSESLLWYDKAIRTLTAVYRQDHQSVLAKRFLRNSHLGRARAYDRLHKHTEAVKDWNMAIELSPQQVQPSFRAARATSRLNAGQVAEAVAEVAELTKMPNWNAGQWYDFACVYAVASSKTTDKKHEYADRAMELLQMAVKTGWKDAAHMNKDTDLDSLRGRDDFKKLIRELENKPAAKKGKQP